MSKVVFAAILCMSMAIFAQYTQYDLNVSEKFQNKLEFSMILSEAKKKAIDAALDKVDESMKNAKNIDAKKMEDIKQILENETEKIFDDDLTREISKIFLDKVGVETMSKMLEDESTFFTSPSWSEFQSKKDSVFNAISELVKKRLTDLKLADEIRPKL